MKKLFSLVLAIAMLFCFAACNGGSTGSTDDTNGEINATSIKFAKEVYDVGVDSFVSVSKDIVIEPAGAKVDYEISDTTVATVNKGGEVSGLKEGTVTVTAKSKDGKVSATATVNVKGFGTVSSHNEDDTGNGITAKRAVSVERNPDKDAIIVLVSKNVDKNIDKTIIKTLDYGTENSEGQFINSGDGFYVIKNNSVAKYIVKNVPAGEYVGLIICSNSEYEGYKTYDNSTIASRLKNSPLGGCLTDDEINAIAGCQAIKNREFVVKELVVKTNEHTVFAHEFEIEK